MTERPTLKTGSYIQLHDLSPRWDLYLYDSETGETTVHEYFVTGDEATAKDAALVAVGALYVFSRDGEWVDNGGDKERGPKQPGEPFNVVRTLTLSV